MKKLNTGLVTAIHPWLYPKKLLSVMLLLLSFAFVHAQDCTATSGTISTEDPTTICALDGDPDLIDVSVAGFDAEAAQWIITDLQGTILALPPAPPFNLEGAGAGTCLIWYAAYNGILNGASAGEPIGLLTGCLDLSNPIAVFRSSADGGEIATVDGETEVSICAGDGISDAFDVIVTGGEGDNSAWIITDEDLNILGTPPGPPFDLEGAGEGTCLIWYLRYADDVNLAIENAGDLEGCYDLSNPITVSRTGVAGGMLTANLAEPLHRVAVANRASGTVSFINSDDNSIIETVEMPNSGEPMYAVYNNVNNTVLVGDYRGGVIAFDALDFTVKGRAEAGNGVFHMWMSPDNKQLWVNNELDKTISVINPTTLETLTTFSIPQDLLDDGYKPHDVILMPNNAAAFVTFIGPLEEDYVVKYSTTSFEETARTAVGLDPHVSLTRANNKLYVASQGSSELKVLLRSDLSEVASVTIPNAHGLGMNTAGTHLYVGNISDGGTNATYTLDLATNMLVGNPVDAPFAAPHNYAVTTDDEKLYLTHSGASNDAVSVYRLSPTPTLMTSLTVGNNPFGLVAYSVNAATQLSICAGDGSSDAFDVTLTGNDGDNSAWIITDSDLNVLGTPPGPPFDLEGAGEGTCLIWHLSYADGVSLDIDNARDLEGCFDLSNPITVYRTGVDGGAISTMGGATELSICAGDGISDAFDVTLYSTEGNNFAWIITDEDLNILGTPPGPPFDLEGAGEGTCLIWHLSYADGVSLDIENAGDLEGCFDLSNPITVYRSSSDGGEIATTDGATEVIICAGDGISDAFDVTLTGDAGDNSAWIITDSDLNVLGTPPGPPFDLEGAGEGTCLIWHLSYDDGVSLAIENAGDLEGCFDLSNPITVYRSSADGGEIATTDGATEVTICAGDGISDAFDVILTGNAGDNSAWIITDEDLNVLGTPPSPPFDLEGAGEGTCLIWHLSYADGVSLDIENAADLEGCFDLSNPIKVIRNICDEGCTAPSSSTVTTTGSNSVHIDWPDVGDAFLYVIRYRPEGSYFWRYRVSFNSDINLYFIQSDRTYEYQIASYCFGEGLSDFGDLENFEISDSEGSRTNTTADPITDDQLSIEVYPNPGSDQVNLNYKLISDQANINVYDLNGKLILNQSLQTKEGIETLDISQFQKGTYIIVVESNGEMTSTKLIKQ